MQQPQQQLHHHHHHRQSNHQPPHMKSDTLASQCSSSTCGECLSVVPLNTASPQQVTFSPTTTHNNTNNNNTSNNTNINCSSTTTNSTIYDVTSNVNNYSTNNVSSEQPITGKNTEDEKTISRVGGNNSSQAHSPLLMAKKFFKRLYNLKGKKKSKREDAVETTTSEYSLESTGEEERAKRVEKTKRRRFSLPSTNSLPDLKLSKQIDSFVSFCKQLKSNAKGNDVNSETLESESHSGTLITTEPTHPSLYRRHLSSPSLSSSSSDILQYNIPPTLPTSTSLSILQSQFQKQQQQQSNLKQQQQQQQISLSSILHDPQGKLMFRIFLIQYRLQHLLSFVSDCNKYHKKICWIKSQEGDFSINDLSSVLPRARRIILKYFQAGGPFELKLIPCALRLRAVKQFTMIQSKILRYEQENMQPEESSGTEHYNYIDIINHKCCGRLNCSNSNTNDAVHTSDINVGGITLANEDQEEIRRGEKKQNQILSSSSIHEQDMSSIPSPDILSTFSSPSSLMTMQDIQGNDDTDSGITCNGEHKTKELQNIINELQDIFNESRMIIILHLREQTLPAFLASRHFILHKVESYKTSSIEGRENRNGTPSKSEGKEEENTSIGNQRTKQEHQTYVPTGSLREEAWATESMKYQDNDANECQPSALVDNRLASGEITLSLFADRNIEKNERKCKPRRGTHRKTNTVIFEDSFIHYHHENIEPVLGN